MPSDFIGHVLADLMSEHPPEPDAEPGETTEQVVTAMLTENTGRHILDSGGAYGRAWEQNQGRDFASEPDAHFSVFRNDFYPILSLYHFLTSRLDYHAELDKDFHAFAMSDEWRREPWGECLHAWALARGGQVAYSGNTYNDENLLDQDFQYHALLLPDEGSDISRYSGDWLFDAEYVAIETHNGCDIRGGYSAPRIFYSYGYEGLVDLLSFGDAHVWCESREPLPPPQTESLPLDLPELPEPERHFFDVRGGRVEDSNAEHSGLFGDVECMTLDDGQVPREPAGTVYVQDGRPHCPECGAPLHVAAPPVG